jgi:hypothetical protein
LWSRPPQPVFYEGTLVITKEEGAWIGCISSTVLEELY